jgi:hypothetical protein
MFMIFTLLFAAAAVIIAAAAPVPARDLRVARGGIVDGSGWEGLYSVLRKEGFQVSPVRKLPASRSRVVSASQNMGQCCG